CFLYTICSGQESTRISRYRILLTISIKYQPKKGSLQHIFGFVVGWVWHSPSDKWHWSLTTQRLLMNFMASEEYDGPISSNGTPSVEVPQTEMAITTEAQQQLRTINPL
ncbi:unnamed protein product, partial [Pocillopora meandrina]